MQGHALHSRPLATQHAPSIALYVIGAVACDAAARGARMFQGDVTPTNVAGVYDPGLP